MAKLYEDWSDGRITEYNFNMMSQKYQTEQQELTEKIERLSAELESEKQTTVDAETWISLIKQYANPTEWRWRDRSLKNQQFIPSQRKC